jgi:hypothetical protein
MMKKQNSYIVDLEVSKHVLESQVAELNSRIETLERSLSLVLSSVRAYLLEPGKSQQLYDLMDDIEKQLKI